MNENERRAAYIENVGHEPRNREDDPDWNYRGTKEEVELLKQRLGLSDEPEMIPGQMEIV